MTEILRQQLWLPGQEYELHQEYPVPAIEELQDRWEQYAPGQIVAAPGVYGVMRLPEQQPRAYVSVDLCEVVRQTSAAMRAVEEPGRPVGAVHPYADGLSFANATDVTTVAQVLVGNRFVPPVADIRWIAALMRSWRAAGVYVFANTSTSPGGELGTIDFMEQYLPGAFDALLLPRNHDGNLPLTKGVAARNLLQALGVDQNTTTTALHIDDLAHHSAGFRDALATLPNVQIATFQPRYPAPWAADPGSVTTETPLEAFARANQFLAAQLVDL